MTDSHHTQVSNTDIIAAELRQNDRDLYLCVLVAPAARRAPVLALYAFNAALTRARRTASEPMAAQLKLKWWYDALGEIFAGEPPHHPLAQALADAAPLGLDKTILLDLVQAHADELAAPDGVEPGLLEMRARTLWLPVFRQVAAMAGQGADQVDAASTAWGLTCLLRGGAVALEQIRPLHDMASQNAAQASGHLPSLLANIYLKRIRRVGFDMSQPGAQRSDPGAMALPKLWWAARRGRV